MKLYRGDSIHNLHTNPGRFRSLGLTTKAFGAGGDPKNIEKLGLTTKTFDGGGYPENIEKLELLRTIKIHIEKSDLEYYNITDYLSFSECEERALFWCSNMNTLELEKISDYKETRYIFRMDVEPKKMGDGVYYYQFKCNPNLKKSDSLENKRIEFLANFKKCPYCESVDSFHEIILINSYEYLIKHPDQQGHQQALKNAKNDSEWLILPNDLMGNFKNRKTQIPRADFWSTDLYTVVGEKRPVNVDPLMGMIEEL